MLQALTLSGKHHPPFVAKSAGASVTNSWQLSSQTPHSVKETIFQIFRSPRYVARMHSANLLSFPELTPDLHSTFGFAHGT